MKEKAPKKADATRAKIVDIAMRLFLDQGFEKTTMREIAAAAGLAPGAAYYHFESKDHMIFDFYQKSYADHLPEVEKVLKNEKKLGKRLAGVITAHLKVSEPYHEISKVLFRTAADPQNPLSPFSAESKPLRDKNILIMRRVLEGEKLDKELDEGLPELLWMLKMAMILYWLHDGSKNHEKTYGLIEEAADVTGKLLAVATLPVLKEFTKKLLAMHKHYKFFE